MIDEVASRALREVFEFTSFRWAQAEIIERTITGDDNVVLMPTGGGKSLCYQLLSLVRRCVVNLPEPYDATIETQPGLSSVVRFRQHRPRSRSPRPRRRRRWPPGLRAM